MPRVKKPDYVKTVSAEEWDNLPLSERYLHVARSQDKVREFPENSNWGPMVKLYLKVAGIFSPAYWCAAFQTWCLIEAGADRKKLPKLAASTYYWYVWAVENKRLTKAPKRGYLSVQNKASGGHIWACLSDGDPHRSLEGNTNPGGSSNGYGVFERKRSIASMKQYPRWGFIIITDDLF